ncbi:hypothetical protein QE410_000134 [Microbacterium sp. SORGH_AS 1204]|uniref:hypothetical protein n=1 Tax=Microbacterium sp. SORGH_AS_1204 TaxID=3041785 RepID=UPI00278EF838|nr:hypothetical protein [Microbacterium sp. SORGH_AS_1204]MDQ1135335.1 hypothetical protein [Microbacterium sp. SORGH_AS_1204]
MAYFIALGILSLAGIIGTVWLVRTDGYGRIPTDPSRVAARADRSARTQHAPAAAPGVEAARPSLQVSAPSGVEAARPSLQVSAPSTAPVTRPLRIARAK